VGEYAEARMSGDGRALVFTLNEPRQSLVRIAVERREAQVVSITDGYDSDLDPSISPTDDRIVFSSARTGNRHLWTARLDGGDARMLTSGESSNDRPVFSPDGGQIAFMSDRSGRRAIWLISAGGGTPRRLVDASPTGGLSWSRNGREIIYAAGDGGWPSLAAVSVADGTIRRIPTPDVVADPTWSPQEDVIAYLSPETTGPTHVSLTFVDPAGNLRYTKLSGPPDTATGFVNGMVAWSPDGRRLAVASQNTNAPASIWIVQPALSEPTYHKAFELAGGSRIRGISWTRDGSAVIIGRHDVAGDIVIMQKDR
jgi:TolB protein